MRKLLLFIFLVSSMSLLNSESSSKSLPEPKSLSTALSESKNFFTLFMEENCFEDVTVQKIIDCFDKPKIEIGSYYNSMIYKDENCIVITSLEGGIKIVLELYVIDGDCSDYDKIIGGGIIMLSDIEKKITYKDFKNIFRLFGLNNRLWKFEFSSDKEDSYFKRKYNLDERDYCIITKFNTHKYGYGTDEFKKIVYELFQKN